MKPIGIKDKNGKDIHEGQSVKVSVITWNGHIVVCHGEIQFISDDISSLGCGYAVVNGSRKTFLSSITKSKTEIEIVEGPQKLSYLEWS